MKTDFLRALLLAVAAALLAPLSSASAQDVQLASHAEMNDVYARLADLESRLAAVNSGVGCADACGGGSNCCDDCCSDCCHAGFIGGAEVLWLKAFGTQGAFDDFNYRDAYRFWVGWQRADGLGVRARFFDYFQTANNGEIVDFETYDIEVFDTIELGCHWTLVAGGGIRYLEYDTNGTGPNDAFFGAGPLASVELYRAINDSWQLYGITRYSILADGGTNARTGRQDVATSTTELQLGAQYDRILASGALGFARIGWEGQWYDDIHDGGDASVSLQGVAISIGVMR